MKKSVITVLGADMCEIHGCGRPSVAILLVHPVPGRASLGGLSSLCAHHLDEAAAARIIEAFKLSNGLIADPTRRQLDQLARIQEHTPC